MRDEVLQPIVELGGSSNGLGSKAGQLIALPLEAEFRAGARRDSGRRPG